MRLIDLLLQRGLSRGEARRALTTGKVLLMGVPTADAGREIVDPDTVVIDPKAPRLTPGRDLVLLHRDPGFVVAWKPSGMLSVPAPREGGQKNALAMVRRITGAGLPVHRLDEDTSGLFMVALNEEMQEALKDLLERHAIDRGYLAIVAQHFPREAWSIQSELVRDRGDGLRGSQEMPAAPGRVPVRRRLVPAPGQPTRHAVTHVALVENLARDAAVISARLETGRTHQVRIHLAEVGHPVLGDPLYANRRVQARSSRLALHACRLVFVHPLTGASIVVEAPLADDLEQLRRQLSVVGDPMGPGHEWEESRPEERPDPRPPPRPRARPKARTKPGGEPGDKPAGNTSDKPAGNSSAKPREKPREKLRWKVSGKTHDKDRGKPRAKAGKKAGGKAGARPSRPTGKTSDSKKKRRG